MAENGKYIIECRDVKKWYGEYYALRGVNLEVTKGEVIVILGPSGSGKSTFIRTINRLEEHQSGDILVNGIELNNDVRNIAEIRKEIGMVFQQFNLFPHLTVLDNITLAPIWVRKWDKPRAEQKAMELLERVKIPEQAGKYPGQPPWHKHGCRACGPIRSASRDRGPHRARCRPDPGDPSRPRDDHP